MTVKFIANNAGTTDGNLACSLQIDGVTKDTLGSGGTDLGTGAGGHTLTGAGAGSTASLVCTTTATTGNYTAIGFTAVKVATIG